MTRNINIDFGVEWVGDDNILVTVKRRDVDSKQEILFTVHEYTTMMSLLHKFNLHFRNKIDDKLIEGFINE
jgi:hypothetical protein